jgi:CRISPR-associated protein Cmr4
MKSHLYYLHTLTGLHVGTGQGIGVIDMPIARERASNLPQVPGSGIKGVLRDELNPQYQADDDRKLEENDYLALFGPEMGDKASEFAGALSIGDARLLCLPIRSWKGTFAWVTCPMILRRYQRDLEENKIAGIPSPVLISSPDHAQHATSTVLKEENKIYLEDLDLNVDQAENNTEAWATFIANQLFKDDWQTMFKERFLIVHDNVFDFLSETATEIRARIKINGDTRTVQQGGLWYEEYLPAETLMWGIVASDRPRNESDKTAEELLKLLPKVERLQIGGNATVGAGQTRWILQGGE